MASQKERIVFQASILFNFQGFWLFSGRVILHNPLKEGTRRLAHCSELKGSPYKTPFTVWRYRPFTANGPNPWPVLGWNIFEISTWYRFRTSTILLMAKNPANLLRLVIHLPLFIYRVLAPSQTVVFGGISEPSTVSQPLEQAAWWQLPTWLPRPSGTDYGSLVGWLLGISITRSLGGMGTISTEVCSIENTQKTHHFWGRRWVWNMFFGCEVAFCHYNWKFLPWKKWKGPWIKLLL